MKMLDHLGYNNMSFFIYPTNVSVVNIWAGLGAKRTPDSR